MGKYAIHQKDTTQDALVAWLEARGCVYQHVGEPIDGFLAVPVQDVDWRRSTTFTNYVTAAVEWKSGRGKLRKSQAQFFEKWPGPKYVLRTQVECAAMLAEIQRAQRPDQTTR